MNPVKKTNHTLKNKLFLGLLLFIFWMILGGTFDSRQLITGVLFTIITLMIYEWILRLTKIDAVAPFPKINWMLFGFTMVRFIIQSAWHHFERIIDGNEDISFIQISLDLKHPYAQTLIANAITLAPGTITVDLEKNILKVLSFTPRNEKERDALYLMVDSLQRLFKEAHPC